MADRYNNAPSMGVVNTQPRVLRPAADFVWAPQDFGSTDQRKVECCVLALDPQKTRRTVWFCRSQTGTNSVMRGSLIFREGGQQRLALPLDLILGTPGSNQFFPCLWVGSSGPSSMNALTVQMPSTSATRQAMPFTVAVAADEALIQIESAIGFTALSFFLGVLSEQILP